MIRNSYDHPTLLTELAFPGAATDGLERIDYDDEHAESLRRALLETEEERVEVWEGGLESLPWLDWLEGRELADEAHIDMYRQSVRYSAECGEQMWCRLMGRSGIFVT